MPDIYLYAGLLSPNDLRLTDPTVLAPSDITVLAAEIAPGLDASTLVASQTASETTPGTESVFISLSVAESFPGTDASTVLNNIVAAEPAPGSDTFSLTVSVTIQESVPGADASSLVVLPLASQSAPGTDALASLVAAFTVGDTGAGVDNVSVLESGGDVSFSVTEGVPGSDATSASASFTVTDTGAGTDAGFVDVALSVGDTGAGADAATVTISLVLNVPGSRVWIVSDDRQDGLANESRISVMQQSNSSPADGPPRTENVSGGGRISLVE